jgi:AcrR family transcriptional regulator
LTYRQTLCSLPELPGVAANNRKAVAQTGRPLGPRALKTRQRLMEATFELLEERSVLDLSVVDIARKVGTSPATFYHYFKDVEEVALRLAEEAADELPGMLERIDGARDGKLDLDTSREIVDAFVSHWDANHAVLQLRNLAADRGDKRFMKVRRDTLKPVLEHFAGRIADAQKEGRVSEAVHPYVAAAALGSILERLSAHHRDLAFFGASREDLVETCARILYQTVTGRAPR